MKSAEVFRPDECKCANCCQTESELRWARRNRMIRITGKGVKKYRERTAYQERAFKKLYPPLFGGKLLRSAPRKVKRFYLWQTDTWLSIRAMRKEMDQRLIDYREAKAQGKPW